MSRMQLELNWKSVGGNHPSVGEKLNRGSETVENTGVQKSASVHLLQ